MEPALTSTSPQQSNQSPGSSGRAGTLLLLVAILVAFATHTYLLDAKSMWIEEGLSVYRAQLDLPGILSNVILIQDVATHDTHPPLFFILLHFLIGMAGSSEFVLRFLPVSWGVLLVPLLYTFATRLLGRGVGVWAAAIGALSPVYLWYSQEARSYTMLVCLTLFSSYSLLRVWQSASRPQAGWKLLALWTGAYLLSTIGSIFTHYGALFILLYQWVTVLGLAIWQRRWWLLGLLAAASLVIIPLLPFMAGRLQTGAERGFRFVGAWEMARDLLNAFSLGMSVRLDEVFLLDLLFLLVALLGLVMIARRRSLAGVATPLYLVGYLVIPTLVLYVLSHVKPMYEGVRHLLIISPAYYVLLAAGLETLAHRFRYVAIVVLLFMAGGVAYSTHNLFFHPDYAKDDLRSAVNYVRSDLQPGEVVVLSEPILWPLWEYYYGPDLVWTALPPYPVKAGEETKAQAAALAEEHSGIWFAYAPTGAPRDNKGIVRTWFDENLFPVDDASFHSVNNFVAVAHYLARPPLVAEVPPAASDAKVNFGNEVLLLGYSGTPTSIQPGQRLHLTLYWQALNRPKEDYSLSFLLVDPDGATWSQTDIVPFNGFYPMSLWEPGTIVAQAVSISVPYACPPGQYQWQLLVYSPLTWKPLQVAEAATPPSGTTATISTVALPATEAASASSLSIQHPIYQLFDGRVALLGYQLPLAEYRAGHTIHVDLYWQAIVGSTVNYQAVLSLTDATGHVLAQSASLLPDAPPASLVRAKYALAVPGRASGQSCSLAIAVREVTTGRALGPIRALAHSRSTPLKIGEVLIRDEERLFTPPYIPYPRSALLGDEIELLGYSLENASVAPGDGLSFTLYWRAFRDIEHNYTVFVHLVDEGGRVWAQGDGLPSGGERPTSGWIEGEIIVDDRRVTLEQNTPPGLYALKCGMYDATTGARLPLSSDTGERLPEDAMVLQQISVTD
jgi:4-amino-4-deoxy-L-arabinose transferase-like glycosyltransferase